MFNLLLDSTSPKKIKFTVTILTNIFMKNTLKEKRSLLKVLCKIKEIFIAGITDKSVTAEFSLEYIAFFPSDKPKKLKMKSKRKLNWRFKV